MIKKIVKCVLYYTLFYLFEIIVFSAILFKYRVDSNIDFVGFLYCRFMRNTIELNSSISVVIFSFVQNIVEVSAAAVLTSFIFAHVLNKEPQLIFPDKLVIRHRTSWETRNKITLGVLLGNKSRYHIHNVVCSVTCAYIKQEEPLLINSEFTLKEERLLLENYYRFSFDLTQFPRQILKDLIEKPPYYENETITVSITGNCNYIGNSFKITRKYKLSDIVYDEHTPQITHPVKNRFTNKNLINPFTGKALIRIDWDELKKIVEIDEGRRNDSVNEIKYIIKKKKKK